MILTRPSLEMTVGDQSADEVEIVIDPSPFPETLIGVPFEFQVTLLLDEENTEDVHLSLRAACPSGGAALLSGDAMGNACLESIETSSKDLDSGSASWVFAVVYRGSTGTYRWTIEAHGTRGVHAVPIDIKPGRFPNVIELDDDDDETVKVAILSTPDFDATTAVDRTSLTFGVTGDEDSLESCRKNGKDVNGDGLDDLVCKFRIEDTGFQFGDTEGILKGKMVDGTPFEGTDSVVLEIDDDDDDDEDDDDDDQVVKEGGSS